MSGNIRLYNSGGYVELQAPDNAASQTLILPTDSIQPALVHINTTTFSAVSSVSLNDVFTSTYDNYRVILKTYGDGGNRAVRIRFRTGGTDATASEYSVGGFRVRVNGTTATYSENLSTYGVINYVNEIRGATSFEIYNPLKAEFTQFHGVGTGSDDTAGLGEFFGGYLANTSTYDGLTIYPNTGNLTGTIRVYGYRNS